MVFEEYNDEPFPKKFEKLLMIFTQENSLTEILTDLNSLLKNDFKYDNASFQLFNSQEELQSITNFGFDFRDEEEFVELKKMLINWFSKKQKVNFIEDISKHQNKKTILAIFKNIKSIIVIPLIVKDVLFGSFIIGYFEKQQFKDKLRADIKLIGIALSYFVYEKMLNELKNNKIAKLNDCLKDVRHDFANDVQSMSLALELISTTDLTSDQIKYFNIITNAKDSVINRIVKLKELKHEQEKNVSLETGFILKDK